MPRADLKLVSFSICPFVQRSVIALNYYQIDYELEYVDLDNKPAWLLERVPTGKVPALFVGEDVLFESSAINEYIEETHGPHGRLFSTDPLSRAKERAWIIWSEQLILAQYHVMLASSQELYEEKLEAFLTVLHALHDKIEGPFFYGEAIRMVDIAIAPVWTRLLCMPQVHASVVERFGETSALVRWLQHCAHLEVVETSVSASFQEELRAFFTQRGSYVFSQG